MVKYFIYALVSGVLLGQAFLSNGVHFLVFIALAPLLFLEHEISQDSSKRKALRIVSFAALAFLLWNAIAYFWLHQAQRPDGSNAWEAFLIPLFLNTFFMSVVFWTFHLVKKEAGNGYGLFYFVITWLCFEKLHLEWELCFPWLNLGNAFAWNIKWVQWYEFTGTFGGSLWVLMANILLFYQLKAYQNTKAARFLYRLTIGFVVILGLPILVSHIIYDQVQEKGQKQRFTALQPDLDPYQEKYSVSSERVVQELIALMQMAEKRDSSRFFVSPETAFPGPGSINLDELDRDPHIQKLGAFLSGHQLNLVSGLELYRTSLLKENLSEHAIFLPEQGLWLERYNAAIALEGERILETYNKSKLVAGVESFPYQKYIEPMIGSLMMDFGGTIGSLSTQSDRTVFNYKNAKVVAAPVICYESIFGEFVTGFINNGANVIFIMTNDSWWGVSDGHRQLLAFGNLRAIENRRSIVRAANSGVSCLVNQKGEILKQLDYGKQGTLTGEVYLNKELTFYTKYGDVIARIALLTWGIVVAYTIASKLKRIRLKK